MRVSRKARFRKLKKLEKQRHKLSVVVSVSLFATISSSFIVGASTLDDIRDLYGKTRVDNMFTEEEKREIFLNWSKVNQRNNTAKIFALEDKETALKVTEETNNLVSSILSTEDRLVESFKNGSSVRNILQLKTDLDNLAYSLTLVKQIGDVIHIDIVPNEWDIKVQELETVLEEINNYAELGDVASALRSPVRDNFVISSLYGVRFHPVEGVWHSHAGLDLASPEGVDVLSLWNGEVTRVFTSEKGGNTIEITHDDGLATRYLHLRDIFVKVGQKVKQYDVIGTVGSTGIVTGSHLHLEVYLDGEGVNPLYFFGVMGQNALKEYLSNNPDERNPETEELLNSIKDAPSWVRDALDSGQVPSEGYFRKIGETPEDAEDLVYAEGFKAPAPVPYLVDVENPRSSIIPEEVKENAKTSRVILEEGKTDSFTNPNLPSTESVQDLLSKIKDNK